MRRRAIMSNVCAQAQSACPPNEELSECNLPARTTENDADLKAHRGVEMEGPWDS